MWSKGKSRAAKEDISWDKFGQRGGTNLQTHFSEKITLSESDCRPIYLGNILWRREGIRWNNNVHYCTIGNKSITLHPNPALNSDPPFTPTTLISSPRSGSTRYSNRLQQLPWVQGQGKSYNNWGKVGRVDSVTLKSHGRMTSHIFVKELEGSSEKILKYVKFKCIRISVPS